MRVLVTGPGGFIGGALAAGLATRHEVLAPFHAELDLTDDDAVRTYLRRHHPDAVVHGAVRPGHRNSPDPTGQLFTNLRMFFNLVRNRESFGRLVFLSSGAVYDTRLSLRRVEEDAFDASVPADEHGFSKYIVARCLEHTENAVELRLFGVFGRGEDYAIRFISNAICKTLFGLPITLRQNRRFSYLYVDDLVPVVEHFLAAAMDSGAYNIVPDDETELLGVAQIVRERSRQDVPILVANEGFGPDYTGANEKLCREMPAVRFTPMEHSVDELYRWYERRRAELDRSLLEVDR